MGTRTIQRQRPTGITARFTQFLMLGLEAKALTQRASSLKKDLTDFVEADHEEDEEKGHLIHTLPEPVTVGGVTYTGFMKQKKSGGTVFLEDEAQALCEAKGFDPDEYTTRYVDQDKIARLYAEDRLTDEEFNSLTQTNDPTWAFVPVKA